MSSRPARPGPPPAALEEASCRADIRWCLDCGAVQSGAVRCQAWWGFRIRQLGFSDLYEAYAGPLRRFVRRLAADRGLPESLVDTDGVVHDTFMVLLSGSVSGSREPIRNPGAWLFTVARNQVSKAASAQRRTAPGDPADHLDGGGAAWASLASLADAEEIRAAREVMHAIAGLPGHQKIATYLRQVEGWSLAEVGAYLNCAASTAGVHISRGTTKVRSSLSASADDSWHALDGYWVHGGYSNDARAHGHYSDHLDYSDHGDYRDQPAHPDSHGAQGPTYPFPDPYGYQPSPGAQSSPRGYPPGRWPYRAAQLQASLLRERERARRRAVSTAGALAGTLLAAATALLLGTPWWLAAVIAAAAGILVISFSVVRWSRREGGSRWSFRWLPQDLWWLLKDWRRQRRFNRWLRTGRPIVPLADRRYR